MGDEKISFPDPPKIVRAPSLQQKEKLHNPLPSLTPPPF